MRGTRGSTPIGDFRQTLNRGGQAGPRLPLVSESASPTRAGFEQLREPQFRRLFAARFISAFGSAMAPVAIAFGVLDLTGSARSIGLVIAAQTVAQLGFQLFGGALADRGSRRRTIVGGDLLAAAAQGTIALLFLTGGATVGLLALLMAVNGVAFALLWPATVGLVPQLVPREQLQSANALLALAQSGAFGLGGAAAGLLVAAAGAGWAIALDAGTFLTSAALVFSLRPRPQERGDSQSLLRDLREGLDEFLSHRWLWAIVAQFSLVVAAWNGGFMIVGPVVAERALGGPAVWGGIAGAFGAGLLVGGLIGMRFAFRRPMLAATLWVLAFSLPLLCLAGPSPVLVIAAAAFLAGVGGELFGVIWNTALHTEVAPDKLSRVSAYDVIGSIALAPVGEALAGPLVEWIGAGPTLLWGAAFIIVPTLVVLLVPEVRTLGARSPGGKRERPASRPAL